MSSAGFSSNLYSWVWHIPLVKRFRVMKKNKIQLLSNHPGRHSEWCSWHSSRTFQLGLFTAATHKANNRIHKHTVHLHLDMYIHCMYSTAVQGQGLSVSDSALQMEIAPAITDCVTAWGCKYSICHHSYTSLTCYILTEMWLASNIHIQSYAFDMVSTLVWNLYLFIDLVISSAC